MVARTPAISVPQWDCVDHTTGACWGLSDVTQNKIKQWKFSILSNETSQTISNLGGKEMRAVQRC